MTSPPLSIIIPAHNEAALIEQTLDSVFGAAERLGVPFEVIVVDDASTDATAGIAERRGARVVRIDRRQIAAARNAGGRVARGEVLVFLDADTLLPAATLAAAWRAACNGSVGGGARVRFEQGASRGAAFFAGLWNFIARLHRWAAGSFVFVRRDAFHAVGGFNESFYAAEEIVFSERLKRHGPFTVLPEPIITSARKERTHGIRTQLAPLLKVIVTAGAALRRREAMTHWYDGKREGEASRG